MIEMLPTVNAALNGVAGLLLIAGFVAIKSGRRSLHQSLMISAFVVSTLFLACYLVYHFNVGSRRFPIDGFWRYVYLTVLIPHIVLAVVMLPMIALTFWRAYRRDWVRHRAIARWTFPIWTYVSITGVVVYLMLYRINWH